jgi:2'-5' RNA ligase
MIALYPPPKLAADLAQPDGLPPAELHVTIAYTGKAADVDADALGKATAAAAATLGPFTAKLSGHARFTAGPADVIVALLDAHALDLLRAAVERGLDAESIPVPRDHGFTAHMTLAYIDRSAPDPVGRLEARDVTFTALTAAHGADKTAFPFADQADLAEHARQAYAAGWALSGGPMTDRVRAGSVVAVQMAVENAHDPRILEATLQIGKLEGTWALFFARRQKLTDEQIAFIVAILARIIDGLPVVKLVERLRAEAGPGVYAADYLKAVTTQAAGGLLAGIYAHDQHGDLQQAVEDALRAAMAEGQAGALALNADKHGVDYDFAKAYEAIYDQLEHLPDLPLMAQDWVQQMVGGAARQLGGTLASLLDAGATQTEMVAAVKGALDVSSAGSITNRAVAAFLNQSISQAMSQASLSLYASEGAAQAYFVTAGDGSVCAMCQDAESGNPFAVSDCPTPGLHPNCRCMVTVNDPAPFQALAALLS